MNGTHRKASPHFSLLPSISNIQLTREYRRVDEYFNKFFYIILFSIFHNSHRFNHSIKFPLNLYPMSAFNITKQCQILPESRDKNKNRPNTSKIDLLTSVSPP